MSRLAFSGEGRYADFDKGYRLYVSRARGNDCVDEVTYRRVVREYCRSFADRLEENGFVDFPNGMGSLAAALIERKPQFRGKKFIGYGKKDWSTGRYDDSRKAFGLVFLPTWGKKGSLRSYGFVGNRRLFKKMKKQYESDDCKWVPIEYNDEMI